MSSQISKKRKFVADGVFRAELNEFFTRELAEEGYSGCDVRVTHARTEVSKSTLIYLYSFSNQHMHFYIFRSLFVQPTPKKYSVKKVAVFASLLLSSKNVSNSLKTLLNFSLRRSNTVVFLPSLNVKV
jgi:hypothetical protein